uniref:D-alanyl-D-alanine carboxypeptidase family protein n=1 Tax=Yoonia sp. TaxID=2212373 RepID=UPI0040476235
MNILRQVAAIAALLILPFAASAQLFDTKAASAYVYDQTTGTVLLAKNADTPLPPASMSKLMTLYMAFEAVADGRLRIDETLPVSAAAAAYGGSSMFLDTTDRVTVEDLLRGVIILSGNDASAVLAEALSLDGTEAGFARMMTARARQLGMVNSTFKNSNGWPDPEHLMSMRDLGILADRLLTDFPTYYPLFSERSFAFDGRVPANSQNRNPILGLGIGADGFKTGYTDQAGYGIVGSAKQGDRRIIFVLSGMDSSQQRAEEAEKIINWAFRQFAQKQVVDAGTIVATADVWMGDLPNVGLTVENDLSLLVPLIGAANGVTAEVVYTGPIAAPVTKGQKLGELVITLNGLPESRLPLVADRDVAKGGFNTRLRTAALVLWEKFAPLTPLPSLPALPDTASDAPS